MLLIMVIIYNRNVGFCRVFPTHPLFQIVKMKIKIVFMNLLKFAQPLMGIAIMTILLVQCSGNKSDNPADDIVTCVVTDKAKLEELSIFPVNNPLNGNISELPRDTRSDAILALIGSPSIHPDFGSGLYEGAPMGIPFILVCSSQSMIPVLFRGNSYDDNYGNESDPGPYPIPLTAPIEGNGVGDSHVLAVDIDNKVLYELYNASTGNNQWEASGGAVWDLKTNDTRPPGWTSADAAGLPILPLLVRYEEVKLGIIDHAIRFTVARSKVTNAYVFPASHKVSGTNTDPSAPIPMGMRVRLKRAFDISGYSEDNQVILTAMKNYGLILADIGSDFFITGAPDDRWDNDDLNQLKNVKATDFEVVQMGEITYK
jgi:hypothetical protein